MIICFIGIDGSGKSTLSKYLYEELKKRNFDTSYIWWLEGNDSVLRKFLRKINRFLNLKSTDAIPTSMKSDYKKVNYNKVNKGRIFRVLYPTLVFFDYLIFGIKNVWMPKIIHRNRIMIFDRSMFDIILAISNEFKYSDVKKMKLFEIYDKLLPKVDLLFFIDVPPDISFSRKKEEIKTIENAKLIWDDYQNLYYLLLNMREGNIFRIDNKCDIKIVENNILNTVLQEIRKK